MYKSDLIKKSEDILPLPKDKIVFDIRAMNGEWCTLPYPNHKKGCPNFGKKRYCPPFTKPYYELTDVPYFIVIERFDLKAQVKKMITKHPEWTERQCRNLLYWQKGVVSRLKKKAYDFTYSLGEEFIVLEIPESNGVNVFETCKNIEIALHKNPQEIVRKVMIVGKRK